MENPNSYLISTIDDLLQVPEDKLDACFADLKIWLSIRKAYLEMPENFQEEIKMAGLMKWKDDGRTGLLEINLNISKEQ